jgi:hypothetical protein
MTLRNILKPDIHQQGVEPLDALAGQHAFLL